MVGPFGFVHGFNKVAGSNTYGPVSPVEALGVWPASNYRLDAAGGAQLTGPGRRDRASWRCWSASPGGCGGASSRCRSRSAPAPLLYLASLPFSGDYSQAKALMIAAPLAMLVAIRPLLAELGGELGLAAHSGRRARRGAVRLAGRRWRSSSSAARVYSSFLALRDAPVGPPGHGAELQAFLPIVHGEPVLYAGQDRYAAYELLGADTHVPLVEFPDADVSPRTRRSRSTPATPTARSTSTPSRAATLEPLPLRDHRPRRLEQRSAAELQADRRDPLLRALGSGPDRRREDRHVLLEGTEPAALADCASPEIRILARQPRAAPRSSPTP